MVYNYNSNYSIITFDGDEFSLNGSSKNYKVPLSMNNIVVNRERAGYGSVEASNFRVGAIYVGRDKVSVACGQNVDDMVDIKSFV